MPVVYGRQAWGLSRAERQLGHQSDVVVFEETFSKMPYDRLLFQPGDGLVRQEVKRWKFFLHALRRYDVFHFHFGLKFFVLNPRPFKQGDSLSAAVMRLAYWVYSLFVGRLDLFVLRLLRKRMFMTYHGDDIRQGDRSRELFPVHFVSDVHVGYYDDYSDRRKRKNAAIFARYCQQLFAISPDLLPMAPAGTTLIRHAGIDPAEWTVPSVSIFSSGRPLVVHAPSEPNVKGTKYIKAAVDRLKVRGLEFDFVVIEGMANAEARGWYEKADLIVDQLLLGWYGVLALECMALGKPVISYIRPEDLSLVQKDLVTDIPVISATPVTIETVLEECLRSPDKMRAVGQASRLFVEKWYRPIDIARDTIRFYRGAV